MKAWVGILVLYLNKYLFEAPMLVLFSHGGVWDIMDKGEDGLWQRVTIHPFIPPNWHVTFSDDFIVLPVTALNLCVSQAGAAHTTTSRQQS